MTTQHMDVPRMPPHWDLSIASPTLAGSAAIALMVLATIRTPILAVGYLLIIGLGTILGMTLLTTAIAMPMVATGNRSLATNRSLRVPFALVT
jgi:hypothetical protein